MQVSFPTPHIDLRAPPEFIPEHRAWSKLWTLLGMAQKTKPTTKTKLTWTCTWSFQGREGMPNYCLIMWSWIKRKTEPISCSFIKLDNHYNSHCMVGITQDSKCKGGSRRKDIKCTMNTVAAGGAVLKRGKNQCGRAWFSASRDPESPTGHVRADIEDRGEPNSLNTDFTCP